jgi:hypothetical protein
MKVTHFITDWYPGWVKNTYKKLFFVAQHHDLVPNPESNPLLGSSDLLIRIHTPKCKTSGGDAYPNQDLTPEHVFWFPASGSGFISERYGSGSCVGLLLDVFPLRIK